MNKLIQRESDFLRLDLNTSDKQRLALLKTIQESQLNAIVQIVYNVLMGSRPLSSRDRKEIANHKLVIRRFVSRKLSLEQRKRLLIKYYDHFHKLIKSIRSDL